MRQTIESKYMKHRIFSKAKAAWAANRIATAESSSKSIALLAVATVGVLALMPGMAMAAPWDGAATTVLGWLTGGLTRTIAIVAVIACGIMAVFGKLSWDWAVKIIVGIVLIFGSATIVDLVIAGAA